MIKRLFIVIIIIVLAGCSNKVTFEAFFQAEMEENRSHYNEDYSYSLVHQELDVVHENDAIAIFTEHNLQGEQIFIAYFEKVENRWRWKQTRGAEWNDPIQWSAMTKAPYIYSGATTDDSISKVTVNEHPATFIEVEDDKRFWYAISKVEDAVVEVERDGKVEVMEELDEEILEEWGTKKENK
ncbi:hypothetical protein [Guptibacillus algicola]|uniref:hypothetical protein n=1 Tax=Guptibacillus algicola TaxID=225844 RepID=UPI001CD3AD92|nr:hypothetical protein [Alkalihalobacillus algicola]MCA0987434.1 hypothetical protein [Alkalihalobacillus algicola]